MLDPMMLPSSHIDREANPAIMLADSSAARPRHRAASSTLIRNCAAAGIPCIKYNMSILGVLRTGHVTGRGGCRVRRMGCRARPLRPRRSPAPGWSAKTRSGSGSPISSTASCRWPNEYKVRLACHPHDPGTPPEGYQGVHRVLGTIDGLKRFVGIRESPYHGLNFCQGTVSENLPDPGSQIFDVIRWFGSRGKIFNVHFRNIVGGRGKFREAFPDEGDIDIYRALLTYHEVGYDGMLMPDHVPEVPGQPASAR